jgi:hypothetical protein
MSPVDATHNCNPPSQSDVVFSSTELGKVTIHNNSTCTNDFSLLVFDATKSEGLDDQIIVAMSSQTLAPGATGILTVGVAEQCGHRYQRDVFFGILTKPGQTYSDWINDKTVYTTGSLWAEPPCGDPPPTTTGPICQDRQADNFGKPLPCTYSDPSDPPAPGNIGWCHVAQNEHTLHIPLTAIQHGHVGSNGSPDDPGYPHPNWLDPYDYPGPCDGRSAPYVHPDPGDNGDGNHGK